MQFGGVICLNCKFEFIYSIIRKNAEYINFHKHNCFELVYYLSGSGQTTIGQQECEYSKNSFSVISPNTIHDERHYNDTPVLFVGFSICNAAIPLALGRVYTLMEHQDQFLIFLKKFGMNLHLNKIFMS